MVKKINWAEIDKAIKDIEKNTVFRITAKCDNGDCFVVSTNGMSSQLWKKKKILQLAEIARTKPKGTK